MSDVATTTEEESVVEWSPERFIDLLGKHEAGGRVVMLRGLADEQVAALLPQVRKALDARGAIALALDPTGALSTWRTFSEVIDALVREVSSRGKSNSEIEELLEWLHASQDPEQVHSHEREAVLTDTLARLWRALSEIVPATLFVFHPHHLASQVEHQLEYLARFCFADPIEDLGPEFESEFRATGTLVAVARNGMPPGFMGPPVEPIELDAAQHLEDEVREYLSRPEVVRRIVEGTRGDVGRLADLVEHLDGGVEHIWMRRIKEMGGDALRLIEIVAIAAQPVEMSLVHRALVDLGVDGYFSRTVKELGALGVITRVVQMGSVRLAMADPDFGLSLVSSLSEESTTTLHAALAHAAKQERQSAKDDVFIATHALGAGDVDMALTHGVPAARKLFRDGGLEQAAKLLGALLTLSEDPVCLAELHAMAVDVWARLGRWRHALRHCGYLKRHVVGAKGRAELALRTSTLLDRIARFETSLHVLNHAMEDLGEDREVVLRARLLNALAEAHYRLGNYEEVLTHGTRSVELLTGDHTEGRVSCERALLEARNVLGKADILLGRHSSALERFERNMEIGHRRDWQEEVARAEGNIAIIAMQRGDYDEAIERLETVLAFAQYSQLVPRAKAHVNLALIYHYKYEFGHALQHNLEALRVTRQSGQRSYPVAMLNLAMLYRDLGAWDRAELMLKQIESHDVGSPTAHFGARISLTRANIALQRGEITKALSAIEAFDDLDRIKDVIGVGQAAVYVAAWAHTEIGEFARASKLLEAAPSRSEREDPKVETLRELVEGRLALHDGRTEEAASMFSKALQSARSLGNLHHATWGAYWHARALEESGEGERARRELETWLTYLEERAQEIPAELRAGFFAIPMHQEVAAHAREMGGEVPDLFTRHDEIEPADHGSTTEPVRDEAWHTWRASYASIVGEVPRMHQIFRVLDRVADSPTTMLILGESGTGKELIAEAIHEQSSRKDAPLIKVNCAAFVESLLMSELFGHEKGAFTGAVSRKIGRFEMADKGTIFLDEIADISPQTQVALLRVLQERQFERVGGTETIDVDVRVVCATNKDIDQMVKDGTFRLDLYYRLKGMVIELPPLRERRDDIPLLVEHFIAQLSPDEPKHVSREAMSHLVRYSWPGNIRELQNFIRSMLLFVEGEVVEMHHIKEFLDFFSSGEFIQSADDVLDAWEHKRPALPKKKKEETHRADPPAGFSSLEEPSDPEDVLIEQIVAQGLSISRLKKRLEVEAIKRALIETEGNITQAAKILKMKRPRLSQIVNGSDELVALKDSLTS